MSGLQNLRSGFRGRARYVCRNCRECSTISSRPLALASRPFRQGISATSREAVSNTFLSRPSLRSFSSTSKVLAKQSTKELLPSGPARTRFAPSPTGYLHLGSLRTALFNYLLAKRTGGQFLLRIEDTDQKRLVPDAEQRLCEDLKWAGIEWDEGPQVGGPFGPYKQSERTELYQRHAQQLLDSGAAFRCFCSSEPPKVIEADPSRIGVNVGGCQGDCASLAYDHSSERASKGERHAVRFRKPAKAPSWTDLVYGKVSLDKSSKKSLPQTASVDGVILLKGDGTPTYHLANVVDDHHMEITHVIRGTEWMASTPLHVALYNAFGWIPPAFAHVGLLTDKDQNKLSKRNFDTDIGALKQKHGILSESLVNFLALLGWRNPGKDDVMELESLIKAFDLKFTRGNTIVSFEKLWYLQKNHAKIIIDRAMKSQENDPSFAGLVNLVSAAASSQYRAEEYQPILGQRDMRSHVMSVLSVDEKNYDNPEAYVKRNIYFFTSDLPQPEPGSNSADDIFADELQAAVVEMMSLDSLKAINPPQSIKQSDYKSLKSDLNTAAATYAEAIEEICRKRVPDGPDSLLKEWRKGVHRHLRQKLAFGLPGPSSSHLMAVLGYEECCRRIRTGRPRNEAIPR